MEGILTKDVEGIGKAGAVVKVKDGFARNFLLLQNKAVLVTAGNMKNLQEDKARRQLKEEKAKKAAEELKAKIATLSLTIAVLTQEEKEKLYANITAVELQKALSDEGIEIDKKAILLEEPIKALGIYQVPLKLHPEVTGEVKVWIVKK